ncbi:aromatic-L-amino-acid decarboxylase [Pseudoalteromonas citrea]|uniref:Aromatic-L-amino-acid decarboxylase n=2 Tax=Pseudoalteromonas citrea TaxID=43655 RepID=A0AAD4FPR2_9GAMM|nr:pyridoxal-dependent decarboxylase [Pseudoalteromonas citrea]KAF7764239.1 aromatic-L-amino-acid decarboxylase [Pseudoalteromonas citrea]
MQYTSQIQKNMIDMLEAQFTQFRDQLDARDVASKNQTLATLPMPEHGAGLNDFYQFFNQHVAGNLSASNGGRYWGFVTGGANPCATFADWLVGLFNQNVAQRGDSIASELELHTLAWLCDLFYLPEEFKGVFTTGATAANVLGALSARQYVGKLQGMDVALDGMAGLAIEIYAATPHASMVQSLGMAGFGQNSWHQVRTLSNSEAMCADSLAHMLSNSNCKGKLVIASAATVTGTDFDDLKAIGQLCKLHGAWLHVDAAFGIFERLLTGPNGKTAGIECADSITLDCHKWLNVPYDCGVFLTRQPSYLVQTCDVQAPYLNTASGDTNFRSMGIENSRRFRALPVWATLIGYGKEGIKKQIQNNITSAQAFARWLAESEHYELVKSCELNVVLFRPNGSHSLKSVEACLAAINTSGRVFMTPGVWQGKPIIRAALSNWETSESDIKQVVTLLQALGK